MLRWCLKRAQRALGRVNHALTARLHLNYSLLRNKLRGSQRSVFAKPNDQRNSQIVQLQAQRAGRSAAQRREPWDSNNPSQQEALKGRHSSPYWFGNSSAQLQLLGRERTIIGEESRSGNRHECRPFRARFRFVPLAQNLRRWAAHLPTRWACMVFEAICADTKLQKRFGVRLLFVRPQFRDHRKIFESGHISFHITGAGELAQQATHNFPTSGLG